MKDISFVEDIKIKEILNRLQDKMKEIFTDKLRNIILYGSYARNDNTSESDMDIMVLVEENEHYLRSYEEAITDVMVDLSLEYGVVLSLYVQSIQEYERQVRVLPFVKNIQREGIFCFTIFRNKL